MRQLKMTLLFSLILSIPIVHGQTKGLSFERSRGKWNIPIERFDKIIYHDKNSINTRLYTPSLSITFIADTCLPVKAVHSGIIVDIIELYPNKYSVIVKDENYIMAYHNLQKPTFVKGKKIVSDEIIAFLAKTVEDDGYELTFGLWQGSNEVNAYYWFDWPKQHITVCL